MYPPSLERFVKVGGKASSSPEEAVKGDFRYISEIPCECIDVCLAVLIILLSFFSLLNQCFDCELQVHKWLSSW